MKTVFGILLMAITVQAQAGTPGFTTLCKIKGVPHGTVSIEWGEYLAGDEKSFFNHHSQEALVGVKFGDNEAAYEQVVVNNWSVSTRCGPEQNSEAKLTDGKELSFHQKIYNACGFTDTGTWTLTVPEADGKAEKSYSLDCQG